jgi:hypothetical protein
MRKTCLAAGKYRLRNVWDVRIAQVIAAYKSSRIAKLHNRTGDEITLDEVECITI